MSGKKRHITLARGRRIVRANRPSTSFHMNLHLFPLFCTTHKGGRNGPMEGLRGPGYSNIASLSAPAGSIYTYYFHLDSFTLVQNHPPLRLSLSSTYFLAFMRHRTSKG